MEATLRRHLILMGVVGAGAAMLVGLWSGLSVVRHALICHNLSNEYAAAMVVLSTNTINDGGQAALTTVPRSTDLGDRKRALVRSPEVRETAVARDRQPPRFLYVDDEPLSPADDTRAKVARLLISEWKASKRTLPEPPDWAFDWYVLTKPNPTYARFFLEQASLEAGETIKAYKTECGGSGTTTSLPSRGS